MEVVYNNVPDTEDRNEKNRKPMMIYGIDNSPPWYTVILFAAQVRQWSVL